jgi:hypothetical protein
MRTPFDFRTLDEQKELAQRLKAAGYSPYDAAKWCRVAPGTARNWFAGQNRMPEPMRALIEYRIQQAMSERSECAA